MTEIGGYCTNCGAAWQPGENYCGSCGTALGTAGAPGAPGAASGSAVTGPDSAGVSARPLPAGAGGTALGARIGPGPGPGNDAPYPREAVIGAVLLTIFMPFIALIAALMLRAQEMRPARREQLKNWAIASGAWLATGWVIAIIVFASVLSAVPHVDHSGPCLGGPAQGSTGQPVGHGNYRFNCVFGGSTVVHLGN
jgi:hypothetical protein